MMYAYDKTYLEKARINLGRMLDFAVYDLKYDISVFFDMFIKSGFAARFGRGDFELIAGMSGVELAHEIVEASGENKRYIKPNYTQNRSKEYWTGWALAFYQWESGKSFARIIEAVPIEKIVMLYNPYHEMDIRHFADKMNELYLYSNPDTRLKTLRLNLGLSQRDLASFSGVPVRTIQQYEQRRKDINKANAEYLVMLSRTLGCRVEDLID